MPEKLGDWCECCQGQRCNSFAHFCDSCHENGQADSFLRDEAEARAEAHAENERANDDL